MSIQLENYVKARGVQGISLQSLLSIRQVKNGVKYFLKESLKKHIMCFYNLFHKILFIMKYGIKSFHQILEAILEGAQVVFLKEMTSLSGGRNLLKVFKDQSSHPSGNQSSF